MFSSYSVLQNADKALLVKKPFPHIVIRNCLDQELYEKLESSYPSDELIANANLHRFPSGLKSENARTDISASVALEKKDLLPEIWLKFIEYHTSIDFFKEVINLFKKDIDKYYPKIKPLLSRISSSDIGIRFDKLDTKPISLDCQIGINTPSSKASSVIEEHTDSVEELYAGLLYFRRNNDKAKGGDLNLYEWKDKKNKKYKGFTIPSNLVRKVGTIEYQPNTLVLFLNTIDSIHSVSVRQPSKVSRRLVNIIGEVYNFYPEGLYKKSYVFGFNQIKRILKLLLKRLGILNTVYKFINHLK